MAFVLVAFNFNFSESIVFEEVLKEEEKITRKKKKQTKRKKKKKLNVKHKIIVRRTSK